ncbi:helicase [filamentous cyanobacterium CCP1]|nr:helicase [filamentous cyanobacterium CCP1]
MADVHYSPELVREFTRHFAAGYGFSTITDARAFASSVLGEEVRPGQELAKLVDEAAEAAIVRAARTIITGSLGPVQTFHRLVDLYQRQPSLTVRSSTSVQQQAYSTPVPIAQLAASLAGINTGTTVYEPSAGHGALLLLAHPEMAAVNELNPDRAADLRAQGFAVTTEDASLWLPETLHDVVIANPPFGAVAKEDGQNRRFVFGRFVTTQIDHAIALQALQAMKPDGRAVLILGGKMGDDEASRSQRYNTRETRGFYHTLYNGYNVTRHFSVWGSLYRRQGAGFPIDLIVIEGRGASSLPLPAAQVPPIYKDFDQLAELLHDHVLSQPQRLGPVRSPSRAGGTDPQQRNNTAPRPLSGAADAPGGVADRAMAAGGNPDGDAGAAGGNGQRHRPTGDNAELGRGASELAAQLEPNTGATPAHHSASPDRPGDHLSRNGHQGSPREAVVDGDVSRGRPATEPGGVAGGDAPAVEERKQVPYIPKSQGDPVGTQVPVNMGTALRRALTALEGMVGPVDTYVMDRLDYDSRDALHQALSAEQIDACALAIANMERGSGFILGDQTGVGKGRVVAAMIRYARRMGVLPIFVTRDTPLYADLIRDLNDIGMPGFNPLVTNSNLKLPLPDGRILKTDTTLHKRMLEQLVDGGQLRGYDGIFTTYHQMQTVRGQETTRRAFLRRFAENSLLILDESHEAGGSMSERRKGQENCAPNRADFARHLVHTAQGVVYSSATYAKAPEVMDLYARTDMAKAVDGMGSLTSMVAYGGVPLQQTLATMLTEAGQYCRRERSFEGVRFDPAIVPVDREVAENISRIMAGIMQFDRCKQKAVKGMDKRLKSEAKAVLADGSTGSAGASSTNFTSIMHNLIDQMLFALKAETTVQQSLSLLRQDRREKPVIAVANTMGSFIQMYATQHDLAVGDALDMDFGDLLRRYLERSRDVIVGDAYGEKRRVHLSDDDLSDEGLSHYHDVLALIAETDFSGVPVSPIDYIIQRLAAEGFRVGEVTGREHIIAYGVDGDATYRRRTAEERSKRTAVETVKAFNAGHLDAIILNRSGSTGISLHASAAFADQSPRHMLLAQCERDINLVMQMLGRIHRTGQVVPPSFTLLMADIPAEKRPGIVLMRKMASLNANTTAARSSGIALDDVPDFLNEYGDQVVAELMLFHPDIHERLDYPLQDLDGGHSDAEATKRVTGRIPLLPLAEQESLYDLIEQRYTAFLRQQEALGESLLEASTLDLDAKTMARMEIQPADADETSPFCGAVYLEAVDVKTPRKPYPTLQVVNTVRKNLGLGEVTTLTEHDFTATVTCATATVSDVVAALEQEARIYRLFKGDRAKAIDTQLAHVRGILTEFIPGQRVRLVTGKGDVTYGVVAKVWRPMEGKGSPAAPSAWEVHLLLTDSLQEISLPLSRINTGKDNAATLTVQEHDAVGDEIYSSFDLRQSHNRETRQMFTGNLLRAYGKYPGHLVNFTDQQGRIRQGLLTGRGFDIERSLEQEPVLLPTLGDARRFLFDEMGGKGQLKTREGLLTIKAGKDGGLVLITSKAKEIGGQYFLNDQLLTAAGAEFFSVADRMECHVAPDRVDIVLATLVHDLKKNLYAFEQRDRARTMLGQALPAFEAIPEPVILKPLTPPVVAPDQVLHGVAPPPEPLLQDVAEGVAAPEEADEEAIARQQRVLSPQQDATVLPPRLATPSGQMGGAERQVARLLNRADLLAVVMQGEDFHLKAENDPFIPLIVERHGDHLYLTHYLECGGDLCIDSEMVFSIDGQGRLSLLETAVFGPVGESRSRDRSFAGVFARNLLRQGFAEALQRAWSNAADPPEPEPVVAVAEELEQLSLFELSAISAAVQTGTTDPSWEPTPTPSLTELWAWGRAARDLNLPRQQQMQIRALTSKVQQEQPVTFTAAVLQHMQADMERYEPFQQRGATVVATARDILQQVGHRDERNGLTFGGRIYELRQQGDRLDVWKRSGRKTEIILQAMGERVQRTTVTEEDLRRFEVLAARLQARGAA